MDPANAANPLYANDNKRSERSLIHWTCLHRATEVHFCVGLGKSVGMRAFKR